MTEKEYKKLARQLASLEKRRIKYKQLIEDYTEEVKAYDVYLKAEKTIWQPIAWYIIKTHRVGINGWAESCKRGLIKIEERIAKLEEKE